ncbi:MAG: aromatic ring-hydroxylating dioxygenase subunit alpha [Alphaproteobacteria bacterium]|nr:aromatic ring-hydroxylating dioxygenase subunit alpha [Alphaproteobacteria bacterium]
MARTTENKQQSTKSGEFSSTRRELAHARHLPGYLYTSPEIYAEEIDKIFMKDWLCVGRVEQYPNVGDYRAMRIAGEPIIICRNQDNKLKAFANVCRHRGVEVAPVGGGNTKQFTCPYHAWLYDLDGKLVGAPFNKETPGYDFKSCRLPEVKIDTWCGYVFVNFDPNSISLSAFLDDPGVRKAEQYLHPEKTRIGDEYTFDIECNWKFVPENLMDIYHAKAIHGTSFAKHFTMEDYPFELGPGGRYHAEYESLTMAPDGETLFGPMPWRREASKYWAFTVFIRPTFNVFGRQDMIQPWISYPLAPDKTRITIWTQYPTEFFEQPAFAGKNKIIADFIRLVAAEDADMMRSLQNGVNSRNFVPGPTIRLEKAIHHTLNDYLDRMFDAGRAAAE